MEKNHGLMRRLKDWEPREGIPRSSAVSTFSKKGQSKATQGSSLQGVYGHPVVATSLSDSRWSQQNRDEILAALLGGAEGSGREASLLTELRLLFRVLV